MENDIWSKESGFIYKGEFYSYKDNLTISKRHFLINDETNEEYDLNCCGVLKDAPLEATYSLKIKYAVYMFYTTLETFDTREEAEHFIELATANVK